ncbi:MAG: tetratricopeptide repeat protein [Terriglobales bacterium]
MNVAGLKSVTRRPPVILTTLLIVAVLAFLGVNRLVNRFHEQEKALARHLYDRGLKAQSAKNPDAAVRYFRAALGYSHDNFQYQLSLARALRDTGRTAESEAYLIRLWEGAPQDGAVNLALGRLYAREQLFDKAVQYYHNAIYGVWPSDAESKRRDTQFELIEFLLGHNSYPQAQAELITMASALSREPSLRLRLAALFARAQDYEHALEQYQDILRTERDMPAALAGAGEAAFQLGRYRTAQDYLQSAVRADPKNEDARLLLESATQVLEADPFARRLSDAERRQRADVAFRRAGERLQSCAESQGIDLAPQSPSTGLPSLKARWLETEPKLAKRHTTVNTLDALMDLVFEIEQQTQATCGSPNGLDQALLSLSRDPAGVDR